jgi:hypothetical protein
MANADYDERAREESARRRLTADTLFKLREALQA